MKEKIKCPKCGLVSYHHADIENKYCSNCHMFYEEMDKEGNESSLALSQEMVFLFFKDIISNGEVSALMIREMFRLMEDYQNNRELPPNLFIGPKGKKKLNLEFLAKHIYELLKNGEANDE